MLRCSKFLTLLLLLSPAIGFARGVPNGESPAFTPIPELSAGFDLPSWVARWNRRRPGCLRGGWHPLPPLTMQASHGANVRASHVLYDAVYYASVNLRGDTPVRCEGPACGLSRPDVPATKRALDSVNATLLAPTGSQTFAPCWTSSIAAVCLSTCGCCSVSLRPACFAISRNSLNTVTRFN